MGTGIYFLMVIWAINIACCVICVKKGKTTLAVVGILLFSPLLWFGAARLAKPGSTWHQRYPHDKLRRSWERFERTPYTA